MAIRKLMLYQPKGNKIKVCNLFTIVGLVSTKNKIIAKINLSILSTECLKRGILQLKSNNLRKRKGSK